MLRSFGSLRAPQDDNAGAMRYDTPPSVGMQFAWALRSEILRCAQDDRSFSLGKAIADEGRGTTGGWRVEIREHDDHVT